MAGADSAAVALRIGSTFMDNDVTWLITLACGIYVNSNFGTLEYIDAVGFTGAAVHLQGGRGSDILAYDYEVANPGFTGTSVNNFRAREIVVNYCGVGVNVAGGTEGNDSNGWKLNGLWALGVGVYQPTPDIAVAAGYAGLGGHLLLDNGGPGRVCDLYAQTSTGRAVMKRGVGRSSYVNCVNELTVGGFFSDGASTVLGGSLYATETPACDNVLVISPNELGRGIQEVDLSGPVPLRVALTLHDGHSVLGLYAPENGDGNSYSLKYGTPADGTGVAPGWWAMQHGNQSGGNAYLLSTSAASLDPGPGWFGVQDGYFLGAPAATPIFRGTMDMLTYSRLREGARRAGDQFYSGVAWTTITADGFRGVPWPAGAFVRAATPAQGIAATVIEPVANNGTAGQKVFKCGSAPAPR